MTSRGEKLYQRIATAISADIQSGRYAPGDRLPGERELAREFDVSRPTVREAMIALDIRGLIEARHGSGLYVTNGPPPTSDLEELDVGAFELIEARVLFEGEAAALAATVIEPAGLAALEETLQEMQGAAPGSDEEMRADRHFHILIAEATGNSLIRGVVETLWNVRERSPMCIHMFAQARREGVNPRVEEHRLIVAALRDRDPQRARATMHVHLRRVTADLLAATELELLERTRSELEAQRARITRRVSLT